VAAGSATGGGKHALKPLLSRGDSCWVGLLHDGGGVLGLALFLSRLDAEARLKDPEVMAMRDVHRPYARAVHAAAREASAEANSSSTATSGGGGGARCAYALHVAATTGEPFAEGQAVGQAARLKRTKPRSFDVRTGEEIFYASGAGTLGL